MKIKKGVIMAGLQLPMRQVLRYAETVYYEINKTLVVTSALDGTHSASSYHYYGYAVDLRIRHLNKNQKVRVWTRLKDLLRTKSPYYLVILEKDHIHVHFHIEMVKQESGSML